MAYFGPYLEPTRDDITVWSWLFEHGNASLSDTRGFRDADSGDFLSHAALHNAARSASACLARDYGLRALQTVAIVSRNSIAYPIALMAASRLGAVVTLLPSEAKADDLAYYFQESSTVLVFSDDEALGEVRRAFRTVRMPESRILSLTLSGIRHLVGRSHSVVEAWKPVDGSASTCAFLGFTSGTTGKAKAVMISHGNVINQLRQMRQYTPVGSSSTVLGILPFYHITGLVHLLHLPSTLDQDLVVVAKFDMQRMMKVLTQYRCTELWLVPPLLIRLLNDKDAQGYDLSVVEQFNTGAAPLTGEVVTQLAERFPHVRIRQSWGMTETTSCLTTTPPGFMMWKHAVKVGKLVPGTAARIVNPDTGLDVSHGQTGELWVKGPQVTMGYLNRPKETSETYVPGGYLRTGDLGAIDDDGFITITDRIKEMIKVRGHAVAPAELEDVLMSHPAVSDAAIIGVPHPYSGESPRAYVVLKQPVQAGEALAKDLDAYVLQRKARYMRLSGGIEFVSEIPKSPSGKILRRTLRDRFAATQKTKSNL